MSTCPTSPLLFRCSTKSLPRLKSTTVERTRKLKTRAVHCAATANEELGILRQVHRQDAYFASGFGWRVRKMVKAGEEMRRVALVQAEAFHEPVALFNDFFFDFFKAEVLAGLLYRVRNSPPDRYACVVAESIHEGNLQEEQEIVGVADVTVQRDGDVLQHLKGAEEYLYVSGIAVLIKFRRKKIATVLLEACDALSHQWGYDYLALRAYEDDSAAQTLYTKAGYRVVSEDPHWITWMGKKRRVLMIKHKHSISKSTSSDFNPNC